MSILLLYFRLSARSGSVWEDIAGNHWEQTAEGLLEGPRFPSHHSRKAVPSGVTVNVAVKAILAGQFKLPQDAQLVPSIYLVSASKMFLKRVSVHIEHCARITSKEEESNYKMIVGNCSQESLPYTFQIRDGIFSQESQLATISVKQFSFIAAIRWLLGSSKFHYTSHCYLKCHPSRPTSWKLRFMITQKLPSWQRVH